MYRPVLGARNLDRKKSEGADAPLPAPLDSFASIGSRQAVSSRSSSIQSAVLGGPRARSDAVYARVLYFRSSIFLALSPLWFSGAAASSVLLSLSFSLFPFLTISYSILYPIRVSSFIGGIR